jgi:hypothetical protein
MAKQTLTITDFTGGIGTLGEKRDKPGSARFTQGLNPFEDNSYITLAAESEKISSTTITAIPYFMVEGRPYANYRYVGDGSGKLYSVDASQVVANIHTASDPFITGLAVYDDYLYYATSDNIGRRGKLSGTPTNNDDLTSWGPVADLQISGGGTGASDYVPPTSIAETAAARQTFTPTLDPIYSITIDVDVVGSGNWTVTVHDSKNTLIGSSTILNAAMATGDKEFTFTSPLRVVRHNEYHFHVTSTVADGGVDTNVATDLEGAEYVVEFSPLIETSTNSHPMTVIDNDILVICNERYLATWDQSTYHPNKITFAAGHQAITMANFEEFIVVGTIKGSYSSPTGGNLYFWDGISPSFTFSMPVTVGAVRSIMNYKGNLVGVYGNRGAIYQGYDPFVKIVDEVQNLARDSYVVPDTSGMTEYYDRLLIGFGSTDDATFKQGVYELGQQTSETQIAYNFPYQMSTGTTQSVSANVSFVKSFGTDLYFGWKDGASYGVDRVNPGSGPIGAANYESLIFDGGNTKKEKLLHKITVTFEPLVASETITPKYKIDRAASFTNGTTQSTVGETQAEINLDARFKELEVGFDIDEDNTNFPKITGIVIEYDDLSEEGDD